MKNKYEIRGDVTAILLIRRNKEVIETIIDTEDLKYLMFIDTTWSANLNVSTNSYYVVANIWNGEFRSDGVKRFISIKLHRVINRATKENVVDHINHDTLNNCKSNLRNVDNQTNMMNRKGSNTNSGSGIRGVYFKKDKILNPWVAQFRINGKGKGAHLGYFPTIEEATAAVEEARRKYGIA